VDGLLFVENKGIRKKMNLEKIHSFACPHHYGFRGINLSVFYQPFVSRWHLFFQSELSLSGSIWLEIDEMKDHLHLNIFSGTMTGFFIFAVPKGPRIYNEPALYNTFWMAAVV
jgi:hypothetical protein